MIRRADIGREIISQPFGHLAKIRNAGDAGLFVELALGRRARVFVRIDAALRHLPVEARHDDLRPVVLEAVRDQHAAFRVEQRDADVRAIGLFGHRSLRRTIITSPGGRTPGPRACKPRV